MAQATFSIRMDEDLKKQFDNLCTDFGMTASTAFNIFARAVVRERKIPFEIVASEPDISREQALQAFLALRAQSAQNFPDCEFFKSFTLNIAWLLPYVTFRHPEM